jgi:hypothetical protein
MMSACISFIIKGMGKECKLLCDGRNFPPPQFLETKMPYDPVMSADFAALESKASARSRGDIALQFDLVSQEYLYYNNC